MSLAPAVLMLLIVLAPFAIFLALLRFVPQAKRERMFAVDVPIWRNLPKETKEYLLGALSLVVIGSVGSHWPIDFGRPWMTNLFWASVALSLGAAFGHWEADRKRKIRLGMP